MKKIVVALTALAAFTGSASAADMGRPYTKAPAPVAAVYNWTGFYIFGGVGGGLWAADSNVQSTGVIGPFGSFGAAGTPLTRDQRLGGSGWFGTVGAGYDWQFSSWVLGIFGDGQFGELRGSIADPDFGIEGREKLRTSWAAGVRLGYLVAPNVLSYVNAGYSGSDWSGTSQTFTFLGPFISTAVQTTTGSFHRDGFFVGGGVENNLDIFGITAPGWFMKTEYRGAYYQNKDSAWLNDGTSTPVGISSSFKPFVQTISTSLVYRFNWGGSVVPR